MGYQRYLPANNSVQSIRRATLLFMGMGMASVLISVLMFEFDSDTAFLESMNQQLKNLESEASFLESTIEEKDRELKNKDSTLNEKDKLLEEKMKTIASLENEIQALQSKKAEDLEAEVTNAYSLVQEMEKRVEKLEHSFRQQIKNQESLELQASEAENKAKELLSKYEESKKAGDLEAEVTKAYSRVHEMEKWVEKLEHSFRQQIENQESLELRASEAENKAKELLSKYEEIKKAGDLEAEVTKAYSRVHEMEKQVEKLEYSLRQQIQNQESLELRASEAENKAKELLSKYEKLHKVVAEQKARVQKAEKEIQFAETTMLKAQSEAKAKAEELNKSRKAGDLEAQVTKAYSRVHDMEKQVEKLEHSLRQKIENQKSLELQASKAKNKAKELLSKDERTFTTAHWTNYGKPAMYTAVEKALEKAVSAHDWAKPHIEAAKHCVGKQIPVVKGKWRQVMITVAPHMETLKVKAIEGYKLSKITISSRIAKAQDLLQPHVQKVKDVSGPYIDQVASFAQRRQ